MATTFREANDHGFETCVLTDCTSGFDNEIVDASMKHFCAFDGLLGYTCSSKPLLDLAATVTMPQSVAAEFDISIASLRVAYRSGKLSPTKVIDYVYEQLTKPDAAAVFKTVIDKAEAMKTLPEAGVEATFADMPYFYGIPFSVSESFDIAKSSLVKALIASGAILIGTTKIEATGSGLFATAEVSSEYSAEHASGGYSFGSALAIAKGLGSFSLAVDTDGSSRIPAAFNGVVGYNVSKGLLPSDSVAKFCPSIDTISVVATTVHDARVVFAEMRHQDIKNPDSALDRFIPIKSIDFRGPKEGGFRFAVPEDLSLVSDEYKVAFDAIVEKAKSLGGTLVPMDLSSIATASKLATPIIAAERVAFGAKSSDCGVLAKLHDETVAAASTLSAVKVMKDMATLRALKAELYLKFEGAAGVDVLFMPTAPYQPLTSAVEADPVRINSDLGSFTTLTNVFEMCAISVKAGEIGPLKLPFGTMIVAPMGMDGRMLDIAELFA